VKVTEIVPGLVLVRDEVHGATYAIEQTAGTEFRRGEVTERWEVRRLGTGVADTIVSTHDSYADALDSL
jgi:hypothetical protein